MNDISYKLKVLESKINGIKHVMVENAQTYNNFRKDVIDSFGTIRRRLTRVERRQDYDRVLIYGLIIERVCTRYFENRKKQPKISRKNFFTYSDKIAKND